MTKRYFLIVAAIALLAAIAGMFVGRELTRPATVSLESGTVLPRARELAEFHLTDTRGAPVSPLELRGHPTLVFFGFTHCPDVCPTTLATLAAVQAKARLEDERLAGLKVALISVDGERDTPELLGKYVASFRGDFIGLTGSAPEIVKATRSFGVAFARVDLPGGNYTMDHSATVFALDSRARIVAVFTPPFSPGKLTVDVQRLAPLLEARS